MSDLNVNFLHNNDSVIIDSSRDIKQSLDRLFLTRIGSVPFNRSYGSHLYEMLFEAETAVNQTDIGIMLYRDLSNLEPRVQINPYGVIIEKVKDHVFRITLNVTIIETNQSFPYVLQIDKDLQ